MITPFPPNRLHRPVRAPDYPIMPDTRFSHTSENLKQLAADVLEYATERGASAAEAEASEGFGQTVTVRQGEVETIEYNRDKGIGVTVYIGKQRGHASTSDFSPKAMRDTVDAALSIAKFTASDDCAGLADPDLVARDVPDLDLWHPWDLPVERAIVLAKACESAGIAVDTRISNSEGATVSTQESQFAYGNTLGFLGGYPSSRHGVWCSLIAGKNDAMQRDDWYETARDPAALPTPEAVGRRAGERAIQRLGARKIATIQVPVLFEAPIAASLLGHFVSAVSGGSLYRRSSFLLDSVGKQVFAQQVQISDLPHIPKGLASSPFDDEGVATQTRDIVSDGVVQGYFLGTYSARKLGLRSTGNAGGSHNLVLRDTGEDFSALLRKMGTGLLVTELMGQGVNSVTGDYSRGAAGYWVEGGAVAYPVQEITIAGNLKEIFRGIVAAGNDVVRRGSRQCGSILVERMTVAGA
jgi:PmbA protein